MDCEIKMFVVTLHPKSYNSRLMKIKYIILSLALALVLQVHAQKQDDMRLAVEYLASQELGGRYPATAGDTLASEYISGKLRNLKLKPIVKGKKKIGF